ncbi:hypothetical protein [Serratia marcescens]|uniref:hypothetical protein n=1 Tax=Serratia marcescens TaxID=615 RepID=UPI000B2205E0|nr:hypothetical protein [Serratia marcescens]
MRAVDMYEKNKRNRDEKRTSDGELNAEQDLTVHVIGSILERITNQNGEAVSSPAGVLFSQKTKDFMFHNKILEAYLSISILNEPGEIGSYLDQFSNKLDLVFQTLNQESIASLPVFFNGVERTLKDVFITTTFNPLSASSDWSDALG